MKSLFLLGNLVLSIPASDTPAAMATAIKNVVDATPISVPEILEGLTQTKQVLMAESKMHGMHSDTYGAVSDLQTTLINKARIAGLDTKSYSDETIDQDGLFSTEGDLHAAPARDNKTEAVDPAIAASLQGDHQSNGHDKTAA